jgi:AcrR family transcriptional regulator
MKTKETRALLLKAAETIFVRDGYEGAELGEIAALAGRTKGAIYSHYKSKEDIFLALFEDRTKKIRSGIEKKVAKSTNQAENLEIMRQHCLNVTKDQTWSLLLLEFKLFALRHPESKERLQKYYEGTYAGNPETVYTQLLGSPAKGRDAVNRSVAVRIIIPLLSALTVEAKFAPNELPPRVIKKVTAQIFDTLLPAPK